MAILHTLRTNKILKVFTFIIVGIGMYLFVDPNFDVPKSIYYSITGQERDSQFGGEDIGSIYGTDIEPAIYTSNFGKPINPGNYDEKVSDFRFLRNYFQIQSQIQTQRQGRLIELPFYKFDVAVNPNDYDLEVVWNDLIASKFIDLEMKKMSLNFSELEQIDLYKGSTMGKDKIHRQFKDWWSGLGIDTLTKIQLEQEIIYWIDDQEKMIKANQAGTEDHENAKGRLEIEKRFKKYYIDEESKIQKYFSIYQQGYFMPDEIIESVNLIEQKTAEGSFIFIPFKGSSSKFNPSQEEIEKYYFNNKFKFINKEKTRKLDYYIFNSEKDNRESKDSINDVARDFIDSANTPKDYKEQAKNYNVRPGSVTLNSIMEKSIIPNIITDYEQTRKIVRWAYGVNSDDNVKEEINLGETYHYKMGQTHIVFCLNDISEEDYKPIEDVRLEIIKELTNYQRGKEISKAIERLTNNKSLTMDELATVLSSEFKNLDFSTIEKLKYSENKFKDRNINDEELIGTFFGMSINIISDPYIGKEGVYILYKNSEENEKKSIERTKNTLINNSIFYQPINFRSQIISQAIENGSVVDNRFFKY